MNIQHDRLKEKYIISNREDCYIMIKGSIYQEDVIILNLYEQTEEPQNRLSQICIINILLGRKWETQHYRRRLQLLEGQAAIKSKDTEDFNS